MSQSNFDKMVIQHKPFLEYKSSDLYKYTYSNLFKRGFQNIEYNLSNYYLQQVGISNDNSFNNFTNNVSLCNINSNVSGSTSNIQTASNSFGSNQNAGQTIKELINIIKPIIKML